MRAVLLVFACLLIGHSPGQADSGQGAADQRPATDQMPPACWTRSDFQQYLKVVTVYRAGQLDRAITQALKWVPYETQQTFRCFAQLGSSLAAPPRGASDLDIADVEAAVMLHTETLLGALSRQDRAGGASHLEAAIRLMEWLSSSLEIMPEVRRRDRVDERLPRLTLRDWYLTVGRLLNGLWEVGQSVGLMKRAIEKFPDDPLLLLATGSVTEGLAEHFAREQRAKSPPPTSPEEAQSRGWKEVARHLEEAERVLHRAVDRDPGLDEARVRLGHVLLSLERFAESSAELARVGESAGPEPYYLARLFAGRALERQGKPGEALDEYRKAMGAFPTAQAARLGLARLLDTQQSFPAPVDLLMPFLRLDREHLEAEDPWWAYWHGQARDGARQFLVLRKQVSLQ